MPSLSISPNAERGLQRCRRFLKGKNPLAAKRAAAEIEPNLRMLISVPEIGRPYQDEPKLREVVIRFGDSGYIAQYSYDKSRDLVIVTAFRHQREASY